jgi:peptidoglycan/xylan/chitin deacetylase (PgdA/CDA1 family)
MPFTILMYHDISGEEQPTTSLRSQQAVISQPLQGFSAQMQWLREHQFVILPLYEFVERINTGKSLPKKGVTITFDDGLASVYDQAFPILKHFNISATVFVVTEFVAANNAWSDQPPDIPTLPTMTWEQIIEMENWGIEIGSHSLSHPRLDQISQERQREEIFTSKIQLEEILGNPVLSFAYPYGRWNPSSLEWVRQTYAGACTTWLSTISPASSPHLLPRVDAYYLGWKLMFHMLSTPRMDGYLAGVRSIRAMKKHLSFTKQVRVRL